MSLIKKKIFLKAFGGRRQRKLNKSKKLKKNNWFKMKVYYWNSTLGLMFFLGNWYEQIDNKSLLVPFIIIFIEIE